jgi:hypothetical protein
MKKLIALVLAVMSLCLIFAGCQTETPNNPTAAPTNPPVNNTDFALDPNVGYKISGHNTDGELWFKGTITGGRFDASANKADAVEVFVEIVDGGCLMYIKAGSAKQYINMDDKSAGASFGTDAASATVYEWNESLKTLVVVDPDNARAFGCQDESTYSNFSCYATSNTSGYNWGQFIAD